MLTKERIIEKLEKLDLPIEHYWLVSGAALVMHGVKKSTKDIDLSFTTELFNKFVNVGYKCEVYENDNSNYILLDNSIEAFENWEVDDIEIIDGIPVGSLESIRKHKVNLGRPKDKKDIVLIDEKLNSLNKK